ncbi:MAG: DUF1836 domain-containing protein [Lachnospiraceae bacterium]|nr:DUF1836 domain-containing protein [Lachnospiraceae bacterium]
MAWEDSEELRELLDRLKAISYVKPDELPNIDLYMDQVTTFMDFHLESSKRYSEDKLLTKTMINNYTKNELLPPPNKKKYSKDHMYLLILIYYLKGVLSITDIQAVMKPFNEKFFGGAGEVPFEKVYEEIFAIQKAQSDVVAKDVARKWKAVQGTYSEVKDKEQQEFLRKLSLICMLSFDVYMKKQLIEQIIDKEFAPHEVKAEEKPKDAEKAKKKDEKKKEEKKAEEPKKEKKKKAE